MMPVKDGFEFRREQSGDPAISEIPVILMSADGQMEAKRERIPAKRYLRKPLELEQVLDAIHQETMR